jgi:hypothetical protein
MQNEEVGSRESGVLSPLFLDFRLPTSDSRLQTLDSRLSTPDSRLQTLDSRLSTPDLSPEAVGSLESGVLSALFLDFRLQTPDSKLQTPDSRLQTLDSSGYNPHPRIARAKKEKLAVVLTR